MDDESGKTVCDLAWLLFNDIKKNCPDEFVNAHDYIWYLKCSMQAATLTDDPEDMIERQVFNEYIGKVEDD